MVSFDKITIQEIEALQAMASLSWNASYINIISQPQIDYMLDTMYNKDVITNEINAGYHWNWIIIAAEKKGFFSLYAKNNSQLVLSKLYLLKEIQGQGIGKKVLEYIKEFAQKNNFKTIELGVNKMNLKAIQTYENVGFIKREERKIPIGNNFIMDDFVYEFKIK